MKIAETPMRYALIALLLLGAAGCSKKPDSSESELVRFTEVPKWLIDDKKKMRDLSDGESGCISITDLEASAESHLWIRPDASIMQVGVCGGIAHREITGSLSVAGLGKIEIKTTTDKEYIALGWDRVCCIDVPIPRESTK